MLAHQVVGCLLLALAVFDIVSATNGALEARTELEVLPNVFKRRNDDKVDDKAHPKEAAQGDEAEDEEPSSPSEANYYPVSLDPEIQAMEQDNTRDIALVFSGGGIRATIGTQAALSVLRKAGLFSRVKYILGLSGGSWGVASAFLAGLDKKNAYKTYYQQCQASEKTHPKQKWGEFNVAPVCGPDCHGPWTQGIDDYFLEPFKPKQGDTLLVKDLRNGDQNLPVPIFMTAGLSPYLHKQIRQCAFTASEVFCDDGKTAKISDLKDQQEGQLVLKDWLGFSSSAWAFLGANRVKTVVAPSSFQYQAKPNTKQPTDKIEFGDSGQTCNLPMSPLFWLKSSVKKVLLFDYSDIGTSAPTKLIRTIGNKLFGRRDMDNSLKKCFDYLERHKYISEHQYQTMVELNCPEALHHKMEKDPSKYCTGRYSNLSFMKRPTKELFDLIHMPLYTAEFGFDTYKHYPTFAGLTKAAKSYSCEEMNKLYQGLKQNYKSLQPKLMQYLRPTYAGGSPVDAQKDQTPK